MIFYSFLHSSKNLRNLREIKKSTARKKNKNPLKNQRAWKVAEREGFEPPVPLGTVVFKTTVIDHSTISPEGDFLEIGCKGTT